MTAPVHPAGCALDPVSGCWTATSDCALEHPVDHDAALQRAVPTEVLGVVEPVGGVPSEVVSSVTVGEPDGTVRDIERAEEPS